MQQLRIAAGLNTEISFTCCWMSMETEDMHRSFGSRHKASQCRCMSTPTGSMVATRSCGSVQLAALMWAYIMSCSQMVLVVWIDGWRQVSKYHYDLHLSLSVDGPGLGNFDTPCKMSSSVLTQLRKTGWSGLGMYGSSGSEKTSRCVVL
jgi:hypothetical protein